MTALGHLLALDDAVLDANSRVRARLLAGALRERIAGCLERGGGTVPMLAGALGVEPIDVQKAIRAMKRAGTARNDAGWWVHPDTPPPSDDPSEARAPHPGESRQGARVVRKAAVQVGVARDPFVAALFGPAQHAGGQD